MSKRSESDIVIREAEQLAGLGSGLKTRQRKPTPRQRRFVLAYLTTGCAAKAARVAGYDGKYAAQAGYKLLRKRKGTTALVERVLRLERLLLRRDLLRGLRRVQRVLVPKDAPTEIAARALGPLVELLRHLDLGDDPACRALVQRLERKPPKLRRLTWLPWERPRESDAA